MCTGCAEWYHPECLGIDNETAQNDDTLLCPFCIAQKRWACIKGKLASLPTTALTRALPPHSPSCLDDEVEADVRTLPQRMADAQRRKRAPPKGAASSRGGSAGAASLAMETEEWMCNRCDRRLGKLTTLGIQQGHRTQPWTAPFVTPCRWVYTVSGTALLCCMWATDAPRAGTSLSHSSPHRIETGATCMCVLLRCSSHCSVKWTSMPYRMMLPAVLRAAAVAAVPPATAARRQVRAKTLRAPWRRSDQQQRQQLQPQSWQLTRRVVAQVPPTVLAAAAACLVAVVVVVAQLLRQHCQHWFGWRTCLRQCGGC